MNRLVTTMLVIAGLLATAEARAQAISAEMSAAAVTSAAHESSVINPSTLPPDNGPRWRVSPSNSQRASSESIASQEPQSTLEVLIAPSKSSLHPIGRPIRARDGQTYMLFRDSASGEVFLQIKGKAGKDVHAKEKVFFPGTHKAYPVL